MSPKRSALPATLWWGSCGLWAYVAWGVLVVEGNLPEFLGTLAVLGSFAVAGKRVAQAEAGPGLVRGAVGALCLIASAVFLVPFALLNLGASESQVTLFLLGAASVASLVTRRATRPPPSAPAPDAIRSGNKLVAVLAWIVALAITAVAAFLAGASA